VTSYEDHGSVQGHGGTGELHLSMERGRTITGAAFPVAPHVTQSSLCQFASRRGRKLRIESNV
jgi:hypothetical protein